jgi:hypothetical protein
MRVLSFDVGIKNLAYCLLDESRICDWGILNISCGEECSRMGCDKLAKYSMKHPSDINEYDHVCLTHTKLKIYSDWKQKKLPKCKNEILSIGKRMVECFQSYPHFLDVDVVIIENQPSLKNPTMKTIQMLVYSYFLMHGVMKETSRIHNIEMINARNKLKVYKGPEVDCPYEKCKKNTYKINKYLAVEYCKHMIKNEDSKFKELYSTSKKKDDLSDAYLQGIYYITK